MQHHDAGAETVTKLVGNAVVFFSRHLEEIARRWPRFDVDDAGLRRVQMSNVAGYSHVTVRVAR
jgi:hypothetical protein